MSCPLIDEHLRTDLDRPGMDRLERHTENCADCAARVALRRAARDTLCEPIPAPTLAVTHRWRAAIHDRAPAPRWTVPWPLAIAATCAAAILVALLLRPAPPPTDVTLVAGQVRRLYGGDAPTDVLPTETWLHVDAETIVRVRGADIAAETDLALWIPALESSPLRIAYGSAVVTITRATPSPFITTPSGAIELEAGRYEARVRDDETIVAVHIGHARLEDTRGVVREANADETAAIRETVEVPHLIDEGPAELPAADPSPAPVTKAAQRTQRNERRVLDRARSFVGTDNVRATELAESVLARTPSNRDEAEALMIAADAWRRRGGIVEAERYYRRAVEHPGGRAFAEEASLRRAVLLDELGRSGDAIELLRIAERRHGESGLAPERAALHARLLLKRGDVTIAASVLERFADRPDRVLDPVRLDVAQTLLAIDEARAARLVNPLLDRTGPAGDEARRIQSLRSEKKK